MDTREFNEQAARALMEAGLDPADVRERWPAIWTWAEGSSEAEPVSIEQRPGAPVMTGVDELLDDLARRPGGQQRPGSRQATEEEARAIVRFNVRADEADEAFRSASSQAALLARAMDEAFRGIVPRAPRQGIDDHSSDADQYRRSVPRPRRRRRGPSQGDRQ